MNGRGLFRQCAFTLLEVLIALGIFAIMALMSYRALSAVLDSREQLSAESAKWRDLSLFFARFEQDLDAVMNRPSRSADDLIQDAFSLNPDSTAEVALAFSRSGYAQAEGGLAAPQRVGYRLQARAANGAADRKLELVLWPQLDMPPRAAPQTYPTLSNVTDFKLRAMDAQGNWQTRWPVPTAGGTAQAAIPNGLEVSVTLASGETVTRLFAMRGSQ
jgi:general secretion pathway protein J